MADRTFNALPLVAPVILHVARIELPSTIVAIIALCLAGLSLFILTIMLDRSWIVEGLPGVYSKNIIR